MIFSNLSLSRRLLSSASWTRLLIVLALSLALLQASPSRDIVAGINGFVEQQMQLATEMQQQVIACSRKEKHLQTLHDKCTGDCSVLAVSVPSW